MGQEIDTSLLLDLLNDPITSELFLVIGLIVIAWLAFFIFHRIVINRYEKKQTFTTNLLRVQVPQMSSSEKAGAAGGGDKNTQQIQEKISVMETFLSSIAGLKIEKGLAAWWRGRSDVFSFEIVVRENKINFYISTPEKFERLIIDQVAAQFPAAVVEPVPDYNIFKPDSVIVGKLLNFKRQHCFPIKTYKKLEADPLNSLINSLGQVGIEDGAAIQIVFRSAHKKWHSLGSLLASKMQQGKKLEDALIEVKGGFARKIFRDLKKAAVDPQKNQSNDKPYQLSPMEQEIVKGLEEKTSKAGVEATIRIVAASKVAATAEAYLDNMINAFLQYNIYQYGNAFSLVSQSVKHIAKDFIYRSLAAKSRVILNTEELASLYHFPLPSITEHPQINWLEARQAPAPVDLPTEGIILGENVFRGVRRVVRITRDDRRRHIYIIGKSGSGKSYMMTNWMLQDIQNGDGLCVMDPHGDLANDIIRYIPKERAEDVIYFNPADMERPMGLNMLEFERPEQRTFVINELMNIFDKLYDLRSTGGPMFEQYFRNAVQLLMEDPDSGMTILEVPRVLSDEDYRSYKLSKCTNPTIKDFWEKEAQKAGGEASLANMVPYITSKLTQFISNDYMRPIISQQKSAFSFRKAMDEKKIILCNMSKGKIGDMNSDLLGMIIIGKILGAALSRVDTPEKQRADFYLYIDEFQNYLTEGINVILSEARKYRLCLNIAHQFVGQLVKNNDTRIRDSIFGNVGTVVAYRVGVDDAELFGKQFSPVFSEYDVMNIPRREVYTKLLIDNQNPPPFSMKIPSRDNPKNPEIGEAIKELSRLKYGRDREMIEQEVLERVQIVY
jgi:hypothetical protein